MAANELTEICDGCREFGHKTRKCPRKQGKRDEKRTTDEQAVFRRVIAQGLTVRSPADHIVLLRALTKSEPESTIVDFANHKDRVTQAIRHVLEKQPLAIMNLLLNLSVPELSHGLNERTTTECFVHVFSSPNLLEMLRTHLEQGALSGYLGVLAWALALATKSNETLRKNDVVHQIADILRVRLNSGVTDLLSTLYPNSGVSMPASVVLAYDSLAEAEHGPVFPGNRHDNDFVDYRSINNIPTAGELRCRREAYLPQPTTVEERRDEDSAPAVHAAYLDRQYRLLREDMVRPLEQRLHQDHARPPAKRQRTYTRPRIVKLNAQDVALTLDLHMPELLHKRLRKVVYGGEGVEVEANMSASKVHKALEEYFTMRGGTRILGKDTLLCFIEAETATVIGVAVVTSRKEMWSAALSDKVLRVGIALFGASAGDVIARLVMHPGDPQLLVYQATTAFFSYSPVLKALQNMPSVPFAETFLFGRPMPGEPSFTLDDGLSDAVEKILGDDESQREALLAAFDSRVSLIQGPPGTGKTQVGVAIVRALMDLREAGKEVRILCLCYTNHALDNFLLALMEEAGLADDEIVRIGGSAKIHARLQERTLRTLSDKEGKTQFSQAEYKRFSALRSMLDDDARQAKDIGEELHGAWGRTSWQRVEAFLHAEHPDLYEQLRAPPAVGADGFQTVGASGRKVREDSLWRKWLRGDRSRAISREDAAALAQDAEADEWSRETPKQGGPSDAEDGAGAAELPADIWQWSLAQRWQQVRAWQGEALRRLSSEMANLMDQHRDTTAKQRDMQDRKLANLLKTHTVIGATTTGAAMHAGLLQDAGVNVVIVEEAAEILECNLLAALTFEPDMLVLIGDHDQLRPKTDYYPLRREARKVAVNHNFNVSLFERLVNEGRQCDEDGDELPVPLTALTRQYRMRPLFSNLIKDIYPDLENGAGTEDRLPIRGVASDLVFINHDNPEGGDPDAEVGASSKINTYEVLMAAAIASHFLKQGYDPKDLVILTPYLGQLAELRAEFNRRKVVVEVSEEDLNDMAAEGIVAITNWSPVGANDPKPEPKTERVLPPIRLSTIDNYQGEESKIVIISTVRSNDGGDIGFLGESNRVSVLLSRARDGMVILGDQVCLTNRGKKGHPGHLLWRKIFERMEDHIYQGLPVRCAHATEILGTPEEISDRSPRGGCLRPCVHEFLCGHTCDRECHGDDHSDLKCEHPVDDTCAHGHPMRRPCDRRLMGECHHAIVDECFHGDLRARLCYQSAGCGGCQRRAIRRQMYDQATTEASSSSAAALPLESAAAADSEGASTSNASDLVGLPIKKKTKQGERKKANAMAAAEEPLVPLLAEVAKIVEPLQAAALPGKTAIVAWQHLYKLVLHTPSAAITNGIRSVLVLAACALGEARAELLAELPAEGAGPVLHQATTAYVRWQLASMLHVKADDATAKESHMRTVQAAAATFRRVLRLVPEPQRGVVPPAWVEALRE